MQDIIKIEKIAQYMRCAILDISYKCKLGVHLGGGLSSVEILATLYSHVMNYDNSNPRWDGRDRFILSKGHGVLSYYSALLATNIISKEEFEGFQTNESSLIAHPVMNMDLGIESSNGSLGQGLSMSVGIALAAKNNDSKYKVYTLIGDGECDEGSIWEAIMLAPSLKLGNLTVIVDYNKLQSDGDKVVDLGDLANKFREFGWEAFDIDGHDVFQLLKAFEVDQADGKPKVIVAHTIKGKGVSFMENNNDWHHGVLTSKRYEEAKMELETDNGD